MSDKKRKVPKLRFPGFTDAWEQRKLGDLINTVKYKDYIVGANKSGLYPVIQQGDRPILGYSNSDPITQFEDVVVFGDHTLSLFNPQSPFLLASDGVKVIRIPDFSGEFTYYILERYLPISQGYKRHYSVLKMQEVFFPAEQSERDRIGELISMFDSLISLHQRKLDNVKMLKKSLLQKLFPKDGEKIPELRFPGFTDAWEQRKLGEVVTFFAGLTYSPDNVQSSGTLVLRSSNVKNGEIVDADNVYVNHNVVNSDNVQVGDIIVVVRNGSRDLIGKHAQVKKQMEDTVIGAFMTGIRTKKPEFMNAMLDTSIFEAEVAKNLGATINQITGRMFSEMSFSMPETKEQAVIGTFFRNLDSLISLHQRKLDHLKELKKGLLQQMFV